MALTNLDFDKEEEIIISKYKKEWELSKPEAIRRIIIEFERRNKK